jgi:50S ribosomal protein L16 3-hydroxylase
MSLPIEIHATRGQLLGMPPTRFLHDYWQKRPLLIRGAFAGLKNPVAPDDLAGLACEEFALARIAIHAPAAPSTQTSVKGAGPTAAHRDRWTLRTGPFAEGDFATLPKTHWTLLVQDVDKWDADAAALLAPFGFLPSWRVDDVMASYAEDGGSVGAHVDQYDVFLLQGLGQRRWQISVDPTAPKAFRDDAELKLLREFAPTHEWILEPGDMLYLPPGVPHHGVAIGACMTYSIGMRAPSQAELVGDFVDHLVEAMPEESRYVDADLEPARNVGEIDDAAIARVLRAMPWVKFGGDAPSAGEKKKREWGANGCPDELDSSLLRTWFGRFITRYRSAHMVAPNPRPLTDTAFARALGQDAHVQRNPWSRFAWMREGRGAILFVAGESHACSLRFAQFACAHADFPVAAAADSEDDRSVLRALIDAGHLALVRARRQRRADDSR